MVWRHAIVGDGKGARVPAMRPSFPDFLSLPLLHFLLSSSSLLSLPTFFSSSSPSFCCFSRTSGAQPPLPCPFRVPLPCPIFLTTCNAPITRTHAFLQPLPPFHRLLTRSSPYFCSPFRPLRDFRCQRPPHRVCGLSAYLVRSPRLSPAHCSHYAPSPPPSVCRFPVPSSSQPAMPQSHAHAHFCGRFRPFTACSRDPLPTSAAPSAP